jgi:ribosome modulation factor
VTTDAAAPDQMTLERTPVSTVEELRTLDERDVISGYWAGFNGREEPGVEFNRSYWHGWRNGMMDQGRLKPDAASAALASAVVESGYLREVRSRPKENAGAE